MNNLIECFEAEIGSNVMDHLDSLKQKLEEMKKVTADIDNHPQRTYGAPALELLKKYHSSAASCSIKPETLEEKIKEFGFECSVERVSYGPVITRYEIRLASGVRLSQIRNVSEDLAIALMSDKVRIQAPIPGTSLVGIEVLNDEPGIIGLRDIIKASRESKHKLPLAIGTDTTGEPVILDLADMPHLLIAGQTGSGKSVCINSMILSLIYNKSPDECQLVMIDPKRVEMSFYKNVPHLKRPVITEPEDALETFQNLVQEMERRYTLLSEKRVRNISSYNKKYDRMPYIVVIVDELADLMMTSGKDLEKCIVRIAQLARAVGIHLVMATQKPVVKVITGLIKSNMPSRIAFQVSSRVDSNVILDTTGAEKLLGRGDMLVIHPGSSEPQRFHGAWVSDEEIESVADFLRS